MEGYCILHDMTVGLFFLHLGILVQYLIITKLPYLIPSSRPYVIGTSLILLTDKHNNSFSCTSHSFGLDKYCIHS